jgi:hypothetical protein
MAHLKTKETTSDRLQRKEWKFRLMRQLYEAGYERQNILNLYRFIDWLMRLPTDLEYQFKEQLDQYEQERQMPYITSIAQATDLTLEQIRQIQVGQEQKVPLFKEDLGRSSL